MNGNKLISFFESPQLIGESDLEKLRELLEAFPFSGLLHLLYVKGLQNEGSYLVPDALKKAALRLPNREVLFQWLEIEREAEKVFKEPETTIAAPSDIEVQEKEEEISSKENAELKEPKEIEIAAEPSMSVVESEGQIHEEVKEEISQEKSSASIPVSKEDNSAPVTQIVPPPDIEKLSPTKVDDINLDALPPRVREIILKSRNQKIQKTTVVSQEEPESKSGSELTNEVVVPKVEDSPAVSKPEVISEVPKETKESKAPITPKVPSAKSEIGSEKHAFSDWLKRKVEDTEVEKVAESPEKEPPKIQKKFDLIDQFIEKSPNFRPKVQESTGINMGEVSMMDESAYVTETLAKIYLEQKHFQRAINAYELLRLKYPEKSGLFADQIEAIKKLKQKNK